MADHVENMTSKLALNVSPDGPILEAPESGGYSISLGDDKLKTMVDHPFIKELSKNLKSARALGPESDVKVRQDHVW